MEEGNEKDQTDAGVVQTSALGQTHTHAQTQSSTHAHQYEQAADAVNVLFKPSAVSRRGGRRGEGSGSVSRRRRGEVETTREGGKKGRGAVEARCVAPCVGQGWPVDGGVRGTRRAEVEKGVRCGAVGRQRSQSGEINVDRAAEDTGLVSWRCLSHTRQRATTHARAQIAGKPGKQERSREC